jgi:pimeloyl-ACP methyl ester carboxylesterase
MTPASLTHKRFAFTLIVLGGLVFPTCVTAPSSPKAGANPSEELIKIETRPDVTQKVLVVRPPHPVATVVLFPSGRGNLELGSGAETPTIGRADYFLARTSEEFARHGFMVALVDVPSDRQTGGIDSLFRISSAHAEDIRGVVSYLKKRAEIPLWLIGLGEGTFSAVNGAISLDGQIEGVILASSLTRTPTNWKMYGTHPNGILNMDLDKITVPVLVVGSQNDTCAITSPADAAKIKGELVHSPVVDIRYFSGGKMARLDPCEPRSPHGFYGIEKEVISTIADFIQTH